MSNEPSKLAAVAVWTGVDAAGAVVIRAEGTDAEFISNAWKAFVLASVAYGQDYKTLAHEAVTRYQTKDAAFTVAGGD